MICHFERQNYSYGWCALQRRSKILFFILAFKATKLINLLIARGKKVSNYWQFCRWRLLPSFVNLSNSFKMQSIRRIGYQRDHKMWRYFFFQFLTASGQKVLWLKKSKAFLPSLISSKFTKWLWSNQTACEFFALFSNRIEVKTRFYVHATLKRSSRIVQYLRLHGLTLKSMWINIFIIYRKICTKWFTWSCSAIK